MNNTVRVKVCGITRLEDAVAAVDAGADAVGFVFHRESLRYIRPEDAGAIASALPPFVSTVGVFVDVEHSEVSATLRAARLDVAQFHGDEDPSYCSMFPRVIKALRVSGPEVIERMSEYSCVSAFLLDAYSPDAHGGTGEVFDWDIAAHAVATHRIILAGGLTPDNIAEAVQRVRPYAVDVSSGVETAPGIKDHAKMREFISRAKRATGP
ncbi:MAG: phosphoribosylanthranilate isomerase [Thermodesulfovibrionales bacterium]|nr:phosphoribosylanthranilate isomerase [Thermodesulfovibrionales bacterium]